MRKVIAIVLLFLSVTKITAQVNLQTGSAVFSLPVFNWQDDKSRLHLNVSLNYNSGNGLKVNEVASNIGQGWNLLAGGIITRMQVGEPDDQPLNNGNNTVEDISKYPAGYLYNPNDIYATGCPKALSNYPVFPDKNHIYKQRNSVAIDREMDRFAFQFNGKSGFFVLKKDDNTAYLLGDSKIKVSFTLTPNMNFMGTSIRTSISTFQIQDEDGMIYRFGT